VHAYTLFAESATFIFSFVFAIMCGCSIIIVHETFAILVPFGAILLHVMINGCMLSSTHVLLLAVLQQ
jgi:hypothetical protein